MLLDFNPKPCPCGCKKWIMHPLFGCQCSSLTTEEKDELMAMVRDANRYRELRTVSIGLLTNHDGTFRDASDVEATSLDTSVDMMLAFRKNSDKIMEQVRNET